jgi:pyruvate dehydrogenase E2 component (dihydrolipoamide acetyltransferase)
MLYHHLAATSDGEVLVQDVTIPALGMAMTEAIVTHWYKEPGDAVTAGEVIADIETDKSSVELESPAAGVLGAHLVPEGGAVAVGAPVTQILDADGADLLAGPPVVPPQDAAAPAGAGGSPPDDPVTLPRAMPSAPARAPHALSPRKRMLARLAAEADAAVAPVPAPVPARSGRRGAIAEQVSQSWRTIPHFAVQREVDASEADSSLAALRAREPHATYTDLLLRAFALAVRSVSLSTGAAGADTGGDMGLAVATGDGVMMPVIPRVADLAPSALVAARRAAVRRGREGRLAGYDLTSAPVASLSNLGGRGVDAFTGIVPVGQLLLLTVGRVAARPVAIEGRLAVRPTLIATLNVDHRYLDGDQAADVIEAFDREFSAVRAWAEEGDQ